VETVDIDLLFHNPKKDARIIEGMSEEAISRRTNGRTK
jgi:hypothetical protein